MANPWGHLSQPRPQYNQQMNNQSNVPTNPWQYSAERNAQRMQQSQMQANVAGINPWALAAQQQMVNTNPWALAAAANSQTNHLSSVLMSDLETGSSNRAPKLQYMSDYHGWKGRFQTYVEGIDGLVWSAIETGYSRPLVENSTTPISIEDMNEDQRKKYNYEKKAMAALKQALPKDILHQFAQCTTSQMLWLALAE